ncbi:hypothetical protein EJB05_27760, partial [Eragrostis curvula]
TVWEQPTTALDSWDPTLINPCSWEDLWKFRYVRPSDSRAGRSLDESVHIRMEKEFRSNNQTPKINCKFELELFGNGLNGSIPTTLEKLSNLDDDEGEPIPALCWEWAPLSLIQNYDMLDIQNSQRGTRALTNFAMAHQKSFGAQQ